MRRLTVLELLLLSTVAACSARSNGFGDPPDVSDAGADAADVRPSDMADMPVDDPSEVGEECRGPRDCVEDALCIGTADDRFVCMAKCTDTYSICDDGSVCLPVMTQSAAICYIGGSAEKEAACASNLDCATGLLCFGSGAEFYCREACTGDECAEGDYCLELSTGAGLCRSAIGAPCLEEACPEELDCTVNDGEFDPLFPSGYCTVFDCTNDAECGPGAVCREVPGATDRTACYATCDHRSDCRFNGSYGCLDASVCAGSSDTEACEALFADESLCAPDTL
jgi:hypothetical protein